MNININSPAYYSREYGIDNEIYEMCKIISNFMKDKEYSDMIDTVGIVPIIAPEEQLDKGLWKEEIKYDKKIRLAYISKRIDFNKYKLSDGKGKKMLITENILKSVKSISNKYRFDYNKFEKDLLELLEKIDSII